MNATPAGLAFAQGPGRAAFVRSAGDAALARALASSRARWSAALRALFEGRGRAAVVGARDEARPGRGSPSSGSSSPRRAFDVELAAQLLDPSGSRTVEVRARARSSRLPLATLAGSRRARREGASRERDRRGAGRAPGPARRRCAAQRSRRRSRSALARDGHATRSTAATSSCRSRACSRAWSARACASTRRRCRGSPASTTAQLAQLEERIHALAGERVPDRLAEAAPAAAVREAEAAGR